MQGNLVGAKELSKLLNISLASVNYYTNLGLFEIKDKKGNVRLYDKNEIFRVFEMICRMRKEGYSLRLILHRLNKGYSI